jgi:hypothetical protein
MERVVIESEIKLDQPVAVYKNVKTLIRETRNEQQKAAEQFGENSKQATALAKKLSELQEKQEDLNRSTKAYAADPFDRAEFTLRGVTAGFQAAAGAAAIFGSESEDVQKALLKVQGAMALSQGVKDILDLGKAYNLFSINTIPNVVKSLFTLRGALIATGIGAIAVAVGTLAANWDKLIGFFTKSFPVLNQIGEFFKNIKQQFAGFIAGAVEGFKVVGDVLVKFFTGDLYGAVDAAKAGGAKIAEAYNKGFEEKDAELKEEAAVKSLNRQLQLLEAQGKDITDKKIALLKREQAMLDKESDEYFEKTLEIEKLRTAQRQKNEDERKKKEEKQKEKAETEFAIQMSRQIEALRMERELIDGVQKDKEADDELKIKRKKEADKLLEGMLDDEKKADDKRNQGLLESRRNLYEQSANLAGTFADLVGRQTAAGKTAALLQIGYDTAKALTGALAISQSPTPDNVATGGLAGIAKYIGIAATIFTSAAKAKQIISSGNAGGGGAPSLPSVNFQAPQIPRGTNVDGAGDIQLSQRQQASRVYVVESDIRRTAGKVAVIDQNATIG